MKSSKKLMLLAFFAFIFMSVTLHKYYLSITEIEYVKEKKSVQIITRIFIDDFERLLRERYNDHIRLDSGKDETEINKSINKYLLSKMPISINGEQKKPVYIGKEYDDDILYIYYEITNVSEIKSFQIENKTLFDMFEDQKNVVRTKINGNNKTFVLIPQNDKGMLNFN
jgi:hypothetical protein